MTGILSRCTTAAKVAAVTTYVALFSAAATAQDALTVGTASAAPGATATVPVYVRDAAGTALGSDAGRGNHIQGIAFKVTCTPAASVVSISFVRAGILAPLSPMYENSFPSAGAIGYVVSFNESSSPIPFTLNDPGSGGLIGNLQVVLSSTASTGSTVNLAIDATTAMLANQAGTVAETAASGGLALTNGSVSVQAPPFGTPAGVTATAVSTSQVNAGWSPMGGVDHFEVYRSFNNGPFALVGSPTTNSFADVALAAATTYLYYIVAVSSTGARSSNSAIDAATTLVFTDDPLTAGVIAKAVHLSELRTGVTAFCKSAGVALPVYTDAASPGVTIKAVHIQELRNALGAARSQLALPPLTFTDDPLPAGTAVKAIHFQEIRNAVK